MLPQWVTRIEDLVYGRHSTIMDGSRPSSYTQEQGSPVLLLILPPTSTLSSNRGGKWITRLRGNLSTHLHTRVNPLRPSVSTHFPHLYSDRDVIPSLLALPAGRRVSFHDTLRSLLSNSTTTPPPLGTGVGVGEIFPPETLSLPAGSTTTELTRSSGTKFSKG